ncbi:MAG: DUF4132 domain-containing protein [Clostridium sp.]
MEINKILLKYGTNLLKVYNQDQKVIDDYEDFMRGEIDEKYYLSHITAQSRVHYSNSLESLIEYSMKCEDKIEILIKTMAIMRCILNESSEEIFIDRLITINEEVLIDLINLNEISLEKTIKYLTRYIEPAQLFRHRIESEREFIGFINRNKNILNTELLNSILNDKINGIRKRKGQGIEISVTIIEGIYIFTKYLIEMESKEALFNILFTVFKEDRSGNGNFEINRIIDRSKGALTNSMIFLIEILKIIDLEEKELNLIHKLIEDNAILKIERLIAILSDKERMEAVKVLLKFKVPEHIILCSIISGENPLVIYPNCFIEYKWDDSVILKCIDIFKETKELHFEYILHGMMKVNNEILEELSIEMVIKEFEKRLNIKNVKEEFERLVNDESCSSDFVYIFERNEGIISVFKSIGAMALVDYKPTVFKKYLSFIYRRSYSTCCSHLVRALGFMDNTLREFPTLINYIISLGVKDKDALDMHIVKLRDGYYQKIGPIVLERYKVILEVLRENSIYNWVHWLDEIYEVIGDELLTYGSYIINSGNIDAIKYIVDKIQGNKKYYNDMTKNCNLVDLEIRKGVILYVLSIEHDKKDEFLENILKNETSKVIKDNINRYFQHKKLKEMSKGGGRDYILSIIRGDRRGNKGLTAFDFELAPKIRWTGDSEDVPIDVVKYVLKTYVNNTYVVKNRDIEFILKELDKDDLKKFAFYILNVWLSSGAEAKEKWVLAFVGENGGDDCLSIIFNKIKDFSDNARHAMAMESLNSLTLSSNDMAINYINSIAIKFKYRKIKVKANECLEVVAINRGITRDELEDIIIPTLGFNNRGERIFSYGDREFTVKLLIDNTMEISDSKGKKFKNLPKGNKSDNEDLVKTCDKEFKQLKKDLKSTVAIQCGRLEGVLISKRMWSYESFNKVFVENPIMTKFALGLIWGVYEEGSLIKTFRYLEDGGFTTHDEDDFEIVEGMYISLVHPLELSKEELSSWREQFDDYEIIQPFNQIERGFYFLDDEMKELDSYDEFNSLEVNGYSLYNKLSKFGWERDVIEDAGFYYGLIRNLPNGIQVTLENDGISVAYDYAGESKLGKLKFISKGKCHKLKEIDSRVFSEILYEIKACL